MLHLPILQTILPLLGAPLVALLGTLFKHKRLAWALSSFICAAMFAVSLYLFVSVQANGTITYALGGWQAPIGIVYVIDAAAAFVLPFICGIALVMTLAAPRLLENEIAAKDHTLFFALWLLTLAGMVGQVTTGDAFNIFVFLEISSLSAYALVAMGQTQDRRALPAAFNYLMLGTLGASFYVIGIGLLYMLTGTLNMADMAERLPHVADNRAAFAALAFITLGLFLKMALFPLHFWLVPAYGYAPSVVSALLAATATKISVYVLMRFLFDVFGVGFAGMGALGATMIALGLAGAFGGTLAAIFERDVKRLLAQSSIAQLGYMAIGIGLFTKAGLVAAFIHLFNHALMKGALFLGVGMLANAQDEKGEKGKRLTIERLHGLGHSAPITMAGILVGGLALIGVPLTAGFISKLYLIRALIAQDMWVITALVAASSALALIYVWRIVEAAWLHEAPANARRETPRQWLPVWILVLATIGFGIYAAPLIDAASAAAAVFLEA